MALLSLLSFRTKMFLPVSLLLLAAVSSKICARQTGEVLYQQCIACHGVQGKGNEMLNAPAISGQDAKYITRQLLHFSNEVRTNAAQAKPMVAIAKSLVKADLTELAIYIQKMVIVEAQNNSVIEGDLKNGSRYYQAKCGACHGGQAQGNKAFNAPRLANQSSQYLLQQMQDFVGGKRGYAHEDKFGRQMAMMANTTKGQELTDILFYIAKQDASQQAQKNTK